jgi:hypothetical protein
MTRSFRDSIVTIGGLPDEMVSGRACRVWEASFSQELDGRWFMRAKLWVDRGLELAMQLETFDQEGRRYEFYSYGELKFGGDVPDGTFDL